MTNTELIALVTVIASVVSVLAAIISIYGSSQRKILDLRLQLRMAINDLNFTSIKALKLVAEADKSRHAIAAATGKTKSGAMEIWSRTMSYDFDNITSVSHGTRFNIDNYAQLGTKQLEVKITEVHKVQNGINDLIEKYQKALNEDEKARDRIRDSHGT